MRLTRLVVPTTVCLLLLCFRTIFAQVEHDCALLLEQSLAELGNSCSNLENDMACYGHKSVTAETNTFNGLSFQNAADRLPLNTVASLATSAADSAIGEWGLALANLTPAGTTSTVQLMLMGDAKTTLAPTVPTSLQINTGFGSSLCNETPSLIAVAGKADVPVTLKINNVDVRITSLVIFQQDSANALKALVYSGTLEISGGATAQAGQTLAGVMDNNGTILFWSAPRTSTEAEAKTISVVLNALNRLGQTQLTPVLLEPTVVPTPTTEPAPLNASCGSGVSHIIQPGENLFRIAMRYGTTIDAISRANGITDPNQIVVGQTLVIPCGVDNGSPSVAPGETPADDQSTSEPTENNSPPNQTGLGSITTIDCAGFSGGLPGNIPPEFLQLLNQYCQHP